jgi:transcriptional regulator with XRE-family HTH domain
MTRDAWTKLQDEMYAKDPQFAKEMEDERWLEELVGLRIRRGLSQRQAAKLAGIHQSCLARLEKGGHEPNLANLRKVVEALGGRLIVRIEERGDETE